MMSRNLGLEGASNGMHMIGRMDMMDGYGYDMTFTDRYAAFFSFVLSGV
jgi:hypothetical protein